MASVETACPRPTPDDHAAKRQKLIDHLFATEIERTAMSDKSTARALGDYIRRVLRKNGHEDLWPVYWDLDSNMELVKRPRILTRQMYKDQKDEAQRKILEEDKAARADAALAAGNVALFKAIDAEEIPVKKIPRMDYGEFFFTIPIEGKMPDTMNAAKQYQKRNIPLADDEVLGKGYIQKYIPDLAWMLGDSKDSGRFQDGPFWPSPGYDKFVLKLLKESDGWTD